MASEGASPELLLGLREAAAACGVSVSTMRRRRHELLAMGATAKDDGWQIPASALVAIGMLDKVNGAGDAPSPVIDLTVTPPSATPAGDDVERLRQEMGVLREDLRDSLERAAPGRRGARRLEADRIDHTQGDRGCTAVPLVAQELRREGDGTAIESGNRTVIYGTGW